MPRSLAGAAVGILFLVVFNVWRQGGMPAVKSWLKSIFINKPDPRPTGAGR